MPKSKKKKKQQQRKTVYEIQEEETPKRFDSGLNRFAVSHEQKW